MSEVKVVIYGASVSAQSKEDSYWGKLSGKFLNHNLSLGDLDHKVSLFRLVYPSSHVSDAGLANLDVLISLDPDIVIFDWLSTDEERPCKSTLHYIYNELCDRGIKILTVAFPRLDSIASPTESYIYTKCLSYSFGQPFLDIIKFCNDSNLTWADVTRDGVHTNSAGAELYANLLFKAIMGIIISPDTKQDFLYEEGYTADPGCPAPQVAPFTSVGSRIIGRELRVAPSEILLLKIDVPPPAGASSTNRISILCKQSIGPFSRQCSGHLGGLSSIICLYDQWCHFTRFAYKPLVIMDDVPEGIHTLALSTSSENIESLLPLIKPDNASMQKLINCPIEAPLLRLHDRLVSINCSIASLKVE